MILCNERLAKILYLRVFLLIVLSFVPVSIQAQWSLLDGAQAHPAYRGAVPRKSDVVFSTRKKRPEAIELIKAFGATRVEWGYSTDKDYVSAVKKVTGWYGGTLNSNAPLPNDEGMAKDFDGATLIHPRMKAWGGKWITTTAPVTRRVLQGQAKKYLDLGADSIQVDDPLIQLYSAYVWGGDFNQSTLAGFNKYLASYPDQVELEKIGLTKMSGDYRDFVKMKYGIRDAKDYARRYKGLASNSIWTKYLRQTVRDYFKELREFLNTARGTVVPLSMNLGILDRPDEKNWHFFLTEFADYAMSETPIASTNELIVRAATIRALGLGYVPSLKPLSLSENRVAIATLYALGAQPVVPWDVYTGIDETGQAKRYFGTGVEYGDLYRFARKYPALFDNSELTAVVGIPVPVDKFNIEATFTLTRQLTQRQIPFAFVLTGGTERKFRIDPLKAKKYKLLVTVNPESDFDPEDLRALHALPVRRVNASQLDDAAFRDLSTFVFAGESIALKLYPRAKTDAGKESLQVHLVDEARGGQATDRLCRRRIGIKKEMLANRTVSSASWFTAEQVIRLKIDEDKRTFYFSIPECTLWGVLSLDLNS